MRAVDVRARSVLKKASHCDMSERVDPKMTPEDEPHPMHPGQQHVPEGFHITEGDAPTAEGYYPNEPGEESADNPSIEDEIGGG